MKSIFLLLLFNIGYINSQDYSFNGFDIKLENKNHLHIQTELREGELEKCIFLKNINNDGIYFNYIITSGKINNLKYLPEGTYLIKTKIKYKKGPNKIEKRYIYIK